MTIADVQTLRDDIARHFPALADARIERAHAFVHDVALCTTPDGARYAIKVYREGMRTRADIEWEVALHLHLHQHGAPVSELMSGTGGSIATLDIDGVARYVTVTRWVPGRKPSASVPTYRLLGGAAARIHAAADSFTAERPATASTVETILDAPIQAIADLIDAASRTPHMGEVRDAIHAFVESSPLDRGVCHGDLTLDNVHIDGDTIHVFDLDSAGRGWRAMEPAGTYLAWAVRKPANWHAWLDGYRSVREFSVAEERAVPWLAIASDIDNVAWKLGRHRTPVGALLTVDELPRIIDGWLAQVRNLAGGA